MTLGHLSIACLQHHLRKDDAEVCCQNKPPYQGFLLLGCFYLVNCYVLFELIESLALKVGLPSGSFRSKHVCLKVTSKVPCLGMAFLPPPPTP